MLLSHMKSIVSQGESTYQNSCSTNSHCIYIGEISDPALENDRHCPLIRIYHCKDSVQSPHVQLKTRRLCDPRINSSIERMLQGCPLFQNFYLFLSSFLSSCTTFAKSFGEVSARNPEDMHTLSTKQMKCR